MVKYKSADNYMSGGLIMTWLWYAQKPAGLYGKQN